MEYPLVEQDIDELLAPIEGSASSVGEDLRLDPDFNSDYQQLREARNIARNHERLAMQDTDDGFIEVGHWKIFLEKVPVILKSKSKDLELVAWYIEALTRTYGFYGLGLGYKLATGLINSYGRALYPLPDEDGLDTQMSQLSGLNGYGKEGTLIIPIKSIEITEGQNPGPLAIWKCEQSIEVDRITDEKKKKSRLNAGAIPKETLDTIVSETSISYFKKKISEVEFAINHYLKWQEVLDLYSKDEPQPTSYILNALQDSKQMLIYIAGDKLSQKESKEQPEIIENPLPEKIIEEVSEVVLQPLSTEINSRQEAVDMLKKISKFYRKTEPHSPISYSLDQIIRWSNLSLPELIIELIPDDTARKKFHVLSGIEK